jgi:hypothetical protein
MDSDRLTAALLSEVDIGQFDSQITGLQNPQRKKLSKVDPEAENELSEDGEEEEEDLEDLEAKMPKCHCGNGLAHPSKMMISRLETCKAIMRDKSKREKEWRRDESVTSRNPVDYCMQFVLSFCMQFDQDYLLTAYELAHEGYSREPDVLKRYWNNYKDSKEFKSIKKNIHFK